MGNSFGRRSPPTFSTSRTPSSDADNSPAGSRDQSKFPRALGYICAGLLVVLVGIFALSYSDRNAQRLITARLRAMPLPFGPLHDPIFSFSRVVGGWCGTALTFDQRTIGYFALISGDAVTVTVFPKGIETSQSDTGRVTTGLYSECLRTGQLSYLNVMRLFMQFWNIDQKINLEGAAPFEAVILEKHHYKIPGDYVWGRMPALTDAEITESSISLRGKMPDFSPGATHDRTGHDLDQGLDGHGFHDVAMELTQIVLTDPDNLSERMRATRFSNFEIVSSEQDKEGTHVVYRNPRQIDPRWAFVDVYKRAAGDDWVTCGREPAVYPSCQLHVVDVDNHLAHQLTFGKPWLAARWRAADGLRARWKSWQVP